MITETRTRGNRYLFVGLLLAIAGMALTWFVLDQQEQNKPDEPATEPVIYVADYLASRTTLLEALERELETNADICPSFTDESSQVSVIGAFQICRIPAHLVTPSMISFYGLQASDLLNKTTLKDKIRREFGNAILLTNLEPKDVLQRNDLDGSDGLPSDMRAVSIAVNPVTSVGGTIRFGQRVDVLVSYQRDLEGNESESVTELLLQNVAVLASTGSKGQYVPANPNADPDSYYTDVEQQRFDPNGDMLQDKTVTLALSLEDTLQLTYMANFAEEIRLIVRRIDDDEIHEVAPITIKAFER